MSRGCSRNRTRRIVPFAIMLSDDHDLPVAVVGAVGNLDGRIMLLDGVDSENQVLQAYPAVKPNVNPRVWVEYGGINDWWPRGWRGDEAEAMVITASVAISVRPAFRRRATWAAAASSSRSARR